MPLRLRQKRSLAAVALFAGVALLPGCVIVQGGYDSFARSECDEILNSEDRLTCERAVRDAEQQRRAEDLRENGG